MSAADSADRAKGRLDQWLWFARLAKSRSLAARMCAAGMLWINDNPVRKPNHGVRIGDVVTIQFRGLRRALRILALGTRRGPASEAQTLYEEAAPAVRIAAGANDWVPLLDELEPGSGTASLSP